MFYANGAFDEDSNYHTEKEVKMIENESRTRWKLIGKLMREMICFSMFLFMIWGDFGVSVGRQNDINNGVEIFIENRF